MFSAAAGVGAMAWAAASVGKSWSSNSTAAAVNALPVLVLVDLRADDVVALRELPLPLSLLPLSLPALVAAR